MQTVDLNNVFGKMGGYWKPPDGSGLAEVEQAMTKHLHRIQKGNYRQPEDHPIAFGFVNNGSFNAFATIDGQSDIIGMHLGLLFILNNLFFAMLSHPAILPKVGNASAEQPKAYDPNLSTVEIVAAAEESARLRPNDSIRDDYAQKLSWIARTFILEHELCHLFNGHVDWLNKHTKQSLFGEIGASLIPGLSSLNLQTLEMDADCYGASHVTLEIFKNGPSQMLANPHMNSSEEALYAIYFALYSLFRIFHNRPVAEITNLLGNNNHPPAVLRQFIVGATISSRIADNDALKATFTPEQNSEVAVRAMRGAEAAFLFLQGREWDPNAAFGEERFPDGIIEACQATSLSLQTNWKTLKSELDDFKRGDKLAE
jgi:hypothetical protein